MGWFLVAHASFCTWAALVVRLYCFGAELLHVDGLVAVGCLFCFVGSIASHHKSIVESVFSGVERRQDTVGLGCIVLHVDGTLMLTMTMEDASNHHHLLRGFLLAFVS